MKYKAGDKVKIRSDLSQGKYYGTALCVGGMLEYAGRVFEIKAIDATQRYYKVEHSPYWWSEEMFEDLAREGPKRMTAEEIVSWLKATTRVDLMIIFGCTTLDDVFAGYASNEIIKTIERSKKSQKPIELEWYDVCRIIKVENDGAKKCVYEEEFKNTPFTEDESEEDIFKRYISEHDGEYFATVSSNLRVKKGTE